MARDCEHLKK